MDAARDVVVDEEVPRLLVAEELAGCDVVVTTAVVVVVLMVEEELEEAVVLLLLEEVVVELIVDTVLINLAPATPL